VHRALASKWQEAKRTDGCILQPDAAAGNTQISVDFSGLKLQIILLESRALPKEEPDSGTGASRLYQL